MGIQTSLDAVRSAERIVDALQRADALTFESSRDPGSRTVRVLRGAVEDADQLVVVAALHALGTVVDDEAARALEGSLSDDRRFVREHAAWVLGAGLPRAGAVGRLVTMVADGGFGGMLAQRTLEQWGSRSPELLAVGVEGALVGASDRGARTRLVETLGLVQHPIAGRPLLAVAADDGEDLGVRATAVAALGERPATGAALDLLGRLSWGDGHLAQVARLAIADLDLAASGRRRRARSGLTIGQLFLHADIDARLTAAGAGDNGGIATLLVRLGDALVAPGGTRVDRVLTMSRGSEAEALADLDGLDRDGHRYGRVPLLPEPVPAASAWPARVAARRGIRRLLRAAGGVDALHLRMADVGSLAAADIARELDIPVVFSVAPDPQAGIQSLDLAGQLTRENFGEADEREHYWFRSRLVQRLAANASHTVLFPRPDLGRDLRTLVGIDITAHPERHTIVPEGVDLTVIDAATADAVAHAGGAAPSEAVAELRRLVGTLPVERRELPLIVSVGRLHRVKGMATLVEAWATDGLRERANLVIVGGALDRPSADERDQLDRIDALVPADLRPAAGLLLTGHRPNDVVARWLASTRAGLPGLSAPGGIYVCASLKEEFGIALLEAMGAGLLVVAPDTGGPATYVEDGVTGYLTRTVDADRLASAASAALDSSLAETDDRRAERSRRTVETRFTIGRMATTLAEIYTTVADDERAARSDLAAAG